jgi:hypothetical protein
MCETTRLLQAASRATTQGLLNWLTKVPVGRLRRAGRRDNDQPADGAPVGVPLPRCTHDSGLLIDQIAQRHAGARRRLRNLPGNPAPELVAGPRPPPNRSTSPVYRSSMPRRHLDTYRSASRCRSSSSKPAPHKPWGRGQAVGVGQPAAGQRSNVHYEGPPVPRCNRASGARSNSTCWPSSWRSSACRTRVRICGGGTTDCAT